MHFYLYKSANTFLCPQKIFQVSKTESCDQSNYNNKLHPNATANAKTDKWSRGNKRHIDFLIIKAFCIGKMLQIKKWGSKQKMSHSFFLLPCYSVPRKRAQWCQSVYVFKIDILKWQQLRINHNWAATWENRIFCICENKDADQLRGNREADQRLCFRYLDSTIPLLSKSEISSL